MASKNKFAKFSLMWAVGGFLASILLYILGVVIALVGLGFAIKGIVDYSKDKSIGGLPIAIVTIVVVALTIIM